MNNSNEIIAEVLKQMILKKITQKQLAAEMNISQQSLSKTLNDANPKLQTLCNICNCLNLEISINDKSDT